MSRAAKAVVGVVAAVVLALGGVAWWVSANHERIETWALGRLKAQAAERGFELRWAQARLWPLGQAEFRNIRLLRGGRLLAGAKRMSLSFSPLALAGGRLRVRSCWIEGMEVDPLEVAALGGGGGAMGITLEQFRIERARLIRGWGLVQTVEGMEITGHLTLDARGVIGKVVLERAEAVVNGGHWKVSGQALFRGREMELTTLRALGMGRGGKVVVTARFGPSEGLEGRITLERVRFWEAEAFSGQMRIWGRLGELELAFKGGSEHILGLVGSGRVWPGDQRLELEARAASARVGELAVKEWQVRLSGSWAEGRGLVVEGRAGQVEVRGVKASVESLQATVRGKRVEVGRLQCSGRWGRMKASGSWQWPFVPWQPGLKLQAGIVLERMPKGLLRVSPAWSRDFKARIRLSIRGGQWELAATDLRAGGIEARELVASGSLRPGWAVQVCKAELRGPWGELDAEGMIDPHGCELSGTLSSDGGEALARLASVLGAEGITRAGQTQVAWSVKGRWGAVGWVVQGRGSEVAGWGREVGGWEVWARVGPGRSWQARIRVRECSGAGPRLAELAIMATGQGWSWEAGVRLRGQLSAGFKAKGGREWALIGAGWISWEGGGVWKQEGEARVEWGGGAVAVKGLELANAGARLEAGFRVSPDGGLEGRLRAKGVNLPQWLGPLGGWVKAVECDLGGTLSRPKARVSAQLENFRWKGLALGDVQWQGRYSSGRLELAGELSPPGGGKARVELVVPLQACLSPARCELGEGDVGARVELEDLDVAIVGAMVGLGRGPIKARASGVVEMSGRLGQVRLSGEVRITGSATLPATGQEFKKLRLVARFHGPRVDISGQAAAEGEIILRGVIFLPTDHTPAKMELSLEVREAEVEIGPEGVVVVTGGLKAAGRPGAMELTGRLVALRGRVSPGMVSLGSQQEVVVLAPGQRPPPLIASAAAKSLPGWAMGARADVELVVGDGFKLSVGEGWVGLEGRLRLTKAAGKLPAINGRLKATGGVIILKGRRFIVQAGQILFSGAWPPAPSVWAEARVDLGRVKVTVTAVGPLADPKLQFSSDPPLPTQDVLSTLIFGRPARGLTETQSRELSAQALVLLGQEGAQRLTRMLGPQLAPEVVSVYETSQGGEAVEAGKYLSSRLYIRYRRRLGPSPGQSVGLEYKLSEHVVIESQVGTTRDSGVDLLFTYEFD